MKNPSAIGRGIAASPGARARRLMEPLEPRTLLATIAWDAGGDGQSLLDPLNWDGDVLPGSGDDAVIAAGSSAALSLTGGSLAVLTLTCDAPLTVGAGGVLSVAQDSQLAGLLALAGGTLSGDGDLRLAGLLWTSGLMEGAGRTIIDAAGGAATLSTGATKQLRRTLVNERTMNHTGGALRFLDGTLRNEAGAVFTSDGVAPLLDDGGTNLIHNAGVFRKFGSATLIIAVPFDNAAMLSIGGGIVNIDGGGTNTGQRFVAASTLNYRQSYVHGAGSTLSGSGTVNFIGGTQWISGDWTAGTVMNLVGARIEGPGVLSLSGPMLWQSGLMAGTGSVTINPSGKLALTTTGSKSLGRDVLNNGALHWIDGLLTFTGATITNSPGKIMAILPGGNVNVTIGSGTIQNAGILRKMTESGIVFTEFNGGVTLSNTGLVDVRAGQLTFGGAVLQAAGPTLSGGSWQVGSGADLVLAGSLTTTFGPAVAVTLYGNGHFSGLDGVGLNLGTITVGRGGRAAVGGVGGTFTNLGTIHLERNAVLTATQAFVNGATGTINIDVAGGAGGLWGRLEVTALATLGGSVRFDFTGGYTPATGVTFQFLTFGSRLGSFATVALPVAGSVQYLAGGARLAIA
ncbi:MAG: hypothetical protein IT437_11210 [Phycisphaerales bacterium]|nr:hypothetical protein [Phycisphaerales bacterium]